MFECHCKLIVERNDHVDRLAILSFDKSEANVITSTGHHKLTYGCKVRANAQTGVIKFHDVDGVFVTIVVMDQLDLTVACELLPRVCDKVEW